MEAKIDTATGEVACINYYSPLGDTVRETFVWNKDHDGLEKTGEVDIQKEIDEAAKGMTANEQIARILRGDTSAIKPGEGFYGDVSEAPETEVVAMNQTLQPAHKLEAAAQANNMEIAALKAKLVALEEEIKKAEAPKEAQATEQKAEVK